MATTYRIHPAASLGAATETRVVHQVHTTLKYLFTVVPIVAGVDKFTNLLTQWDAYLHPLALSLVPVSAGTFMAIVGVIEIVAGVLVFVRPRIGGFVVAGWLLAIALQLLIGWRFVDVAVRDIVIALSGPLVLARLTPLVAASNHHATDRSEVA